MPMPVRAVVVIEDDDAIRTAVRIALEDAGYAVEETDDGRNGLELLRWAPEPLVVVLDLMLPGISGVGILRLAGHDPRLARHRYVVATAVRISPVADLAADLDQYLPPGHLTVVAKPFDIAPLAAAVERAWRQLANESAAP